MREMAFDDDVLYSIEKAGSENEPDVRGHESSWGKVRSANVTGENTFVNRLKSVKIDPSYGSYRVCS